MKIKLVSIVFLTSLLWSCSVPKDVAYFQDVSSLTPEQIQQMNYSYISQICADDLLTITVTNWDPTVVTPFNPPAYSYAVQGETVAASSSLLHTYLVDKDGYIIFPIVGKIKAAGQSKQEFSEKLRAEIAKSVETALVNVQIVNYKVTMMGEFSRPGTISVRNDRISILDAIGQAGDLTINANRKNILIIRDNNGEKEFGFIDLTDSQLFTSPFFYLRQNDAVYAEPNDAKKRNANYSQAQQYSVTIFSAILSSVSVVASIIIAATR